MDPCYLFVYGTLRRDVSPERHALLAGQGSFVASGYVYGRLYEIHGYPGLVESNDHEELVHGELFRISDPDSLFECLDRYEECSAEFPSPHEYVRKQVTVYQTDSESRIAWTYLYNRDVAKRLRIVSGDYLKYLSERS